jgi:hypothetical protein
VREKVAKKQFLFEKKNQKTIITYHEYRGGTTRSGTKVFWFFFSKKELLLFVPAGANLKRKH